MGGFGSSGGEGSKRRLIETRVLLHRADGWVALPYVWNEEQTEATLALAGARREVTTPYGERISYRVPNKNQCKECHGLHGAVTPIGPKTRNLSAQWLQAFLGTVPLADIRSGCGEIMKAALNDLVASKDARINFGMMLFPHSSGECAPGQVSTPIMPRNGAAIMSTLGGIVDDLLGKLADARDARDR